METSICVPLQQANVAPRTMDSERVVRNLHVKGSTSQPSRVAEGREQTMTVRKSHRECSGKVTALSTQRGWGSRSFIQTSLMSMFFSLKDSAKFY